MALVDGEADDGSGSHTDPVLTIVDQGAEIGVVTGSAILLLRV